MNELLDANFVTSFQNSGEVEFKDSLSANSMYGWFPISPMKMYHCENDSIVPMSNSQSLYDYFILQGAADLEFIHAPGDHSDCCLIHTSLAWFDTF